MIGVKAVIFLPASLQVWDFTDSCLDSGLHHYGRAAVHHDESKKKSLNSLLPVSELSNETVKQ